MLLHEELTFTSEIVEQTAVNLDDTPSRYTVVLGYHGTPADFPSSLRPVFESADVVLHEFMGWQPAQTKIMNDISFATAEQPVLLEAARNYYLNVPISMKRLRLISGTQAGHNFWDVPESHPELSRIIAGRTKKFYDPDRHEGLGNATIRSDTLALAAMADRIGSVEPPKMKGDKRHVVVHAGMAHVLLYNGLRLAAESRGEELTLHIPFDADMDRLADQSPEVMEAVVSTQGGSLDDQSIRRYNLYREIDAAGCVMKGPAHKYVKKIWQLVDKELVVAG